MAFFGNKTDYATCRRNAIIFFLLPKYIKLISGMFSWICLQVFKRFGIS
jgi:hypothetical protein